MKVYVSKVYNINKGSSIITGVASTEGIAMRQGKAYIATFGEMPCELDWDRFCNTLNYYYDHFTLSIELFELDELAG